MYVLVVMVESREILFCVSDFKLCILVLCTQATTTISDEPIGVFGAYNMKLIQQVQLEVVKHAHQCGRRSFGVMARALTLIDFTAVCSLTHSAGLTSTRGINSPSRMS